jgi:hypothetical protein
MATWKKRRRRPTFGKNITANLQFDRASLSKLERALIELMRVADRETVDETLMSGAQVVKRAQIKLGPGPHIEIEFAKNINSLKKGSASKKIKARIGPESRYVMVGPDRKHWYYQFHETGVKPHGPKRKYSRSQKASRGLAKPESGKTANRRPMMSWMENGKRIFAKQVRGFAAKPFVEPSVTENQGEILRAMAAVLRDEILKAVVSR